MKVIYVSNVCVPKTYEGLYEDAKYKSSEAVQKYHRVLAEGFAYSDHNEVVAISVLPINASMPAKFYYRNVECLNNVTYKYIAILNRPIIKALLIGVQVFWKVLAEAVKTKSIVICDSLCWTASCSAILASKLTKTKTVGIVTDCPEFFKGILKRRLVAFNMLFSMLDSYMFLTKQMNEKVNKKHKPYVVIEGQVDKKEERTVLKKQKENYLKVCMYAGILQKQYGLELLVKGFIKAGLDDWQLHLYGNGDYVGELENVCKQHSNVKYFHSMPNDIIVQKEKEADLLVNPRPSGEEYTKYSFPSKNMEYMVSGTPTVTTRLPGMPEEYLKYVYTIREESVDGICQTFREIASVSEKDRQELGQRAREFVLREKNNQKQAAKILEMADKICK